MRVLLKPVLVLLAVWMLWSPIAFGGRVMIYWLDHAASAFRLLGVTAPSTGWLLLGLLLGALGGLVVALRRCGWRMGKASVALLGVAAGWALLFAAGRAPPGGAQDRPDTPSVRALPSLHVLVTVPGDGLNLRSSPSATSGVVGILPGGMTLAVVDSSPDRAWYRVLVEAGDRRITGWVSRRRVVRR